MKPIIVCLDMEGVLVPEIWINIARAVKIKALRLTTRDEPDYDKLMRRRLAILRENKIKLSRIQRVISRMKPLPGARKFLDKLRASHQVIILSDTYYEFAMPLMAKLGFPALFCNRLSVDRRGYVADYHLRQSDGKQKAVRGLKDLGFVVHAAGDSYNDVTMLKAADRGILFNPPAGIAREFSQFKIAKNYGGLFEALTA